MKVVRTGGGLPYISHIAPKVGFLGIFGRKTLCSFWSGFELSPTQTFLGVRHAFLPHETSADLSEKKRRPITVDFQIWEVLFWTLRNFALDFIAPEKIRKVYER